MSYAVLIAWVAVMAVLINRTYIQASPTNLATDLARYGPTAVWRGLYYRGEKIGFTVSQTVRTEGGFELQEDGLRPRFGHQSYSTTSEEPPSSTFNNYWDIPPRDIE